MTHGVRALAVLPYQSCDRLAIVYFGCWCEQYGRSLRGVGGMNKNVFSRDRAAVDQEIERLRELVALGCYIPCPDHHIAPDAEWDLVRYYCQRMREIA